MNCKTCGAGMPDASEYCPVCGGKAVKQEGPVSASAPVEYMLVLQTIWDGREEEVAAGIAELAKKDVETALGYLNKLPLTLGRKFSEEKARKVKTMLEAAGGLVEVTPPLDEDEASGGSGDLPTEDKHAEPTYSPDTEYSEPADDYAPPLVSAAQPGSFGAEDAGLPPPGADEQPITMAEVAHPKPAEKARPSAGSGPGNGGPRAQGPVALTEEEEMSFFVDKNYDEKYKRKFGKFEDADGFAGTWHWPCFFFGFWWFLYRKMYLWAVISIPISFFGIFGMIAQGLLGNFLYWKHAKARTGELRQEYRTKYGGSPDQAGYKAFLAASGGTSGIVWVAAPLLGIFMFGILAAIAIPNFLMYQAKAKQSEAKTNLKDLSAKQAEFLTANGRYAVNFDELGWSPAPDGKGGNVYSYFLSGSEVLPGDGNVDTLPDGVEAAVGTFDFHIVAAGNVDSDDTLDVWSIDDAGQLVNDVNDIQVR